MCVLDIGGFVETAIQMTNYAQWWATVIASLLGAVMIPWVLWKHGPSVIEHPVKTVVVAALQTAGGAILCGMIMMGPGIALYSVYPEVGPTVMTRPVGAVIVVFWLVVCAYVIAAGGYRTIHQQSFRRRHVPLS